MNIRQVAEQLAAFPPPKHLEEGIALVRQFTSVEPSFVMPSLAMGAEGIFFESVFLITAKHIFEVHLSGGQTEFDVAALHSVRNYRVKTFPVKVPRPDGTADEYEGAQLRFYHIAGDTFHNTINYVGKNRLAWLKYAVTALPMDDLVFAR